MLCLGLGNRVLTLISNFKNNSSHGNKDNWNNNRKLDNPYTAEKHKQDEVRYLWIRKNLLHITM